MSAKVGQPSDCTAKPTRELWLASIRSCRRCPRLGRPACPHCDRRQQTGNYALVVSRGCPWVRVGHQDGRSQVRLSPLRTATLLAGDLSQVVALKVGGSSPLGHPSHPRSERCSADRDYTESP